MSRIRIMAVVLVVPAALLMLQVSNALAWHPLVVATGCGDNGKPWASVTAQDLNQYNQSSWKIDVRNQSGDVVKTVTGTWNVGGPDTQVIWKGEVPPVAGTYTVELHGQADSRSAPFTIESCTSPTPTQSPSPSPTSTPTTTPTPTATPTPTGGGNGGGTPGLPDTGLAPA
jgi:hypothetical protein